MAPAKSRVTMHADLFGRGPYRCRLQHRAEVIEPFLTQAQAGQRCAAQVVEGAAALPAAVALQTARLAVPIIAFAGASGAAPPAVPDLAEESNDSVEAGRRMERRKGLQALRKVQRGQLGKPFPEARCAHGRFLSVETGVRPWNCSAVQASSICKPDTAFENDEHHMI